MRRSLVVSLVFVLAWALPSRLHAQPVSSNKGGGYKAVKVPELHYEKYTLPNGLEVILSEDHRLPMVAVDIWYHVGPMKERAGRTGFAHLFEHMMFEGSKHVGEKAHFKYLEAAGASDINGTTSFDRTNYFETLPSNQLELALWLESDRMGFLLDTLDRAKLTNQRDVVRNERRQSGENRPYGIVDEALYHELFPQDHPYYADVIGSHADIEAARLNDVRDFFRQYYAPNNATLVIVGDIRKEQAKALIEKYFGPVPRGPAVPKVEAKTPAITSEHKATITDTVQLEKVDIGWLTPPAFTAGDADANMAAQILGGGKSSRLYQKLVYQQQIAQSASCFSDSLTLTSTFQCQVLARPGVNAQQLDAAIMGIVAEFSKSGPTQAELDRARTTAESETIRGLQRLGGFGGVADTFNLYNQYVGDPGYLGKDLARYDKVTTTSVQQFAQASLGANQRAVVYGVPGKKVLADVPRSPADTDANIKVEPQYPTAFMTQQSWRDTAPKPGPQPDLKLPEPQIFSLSNGLKVYLVEQHSLPVFSASLVSLAGSDGDAPNKPGVSGFASAMLTEGTTNRSATRIAEDTDQMGATLTKSASNDVALVNISALTSSIDPALDLLADVTLHPAFDAQEVERIRKMRLTTFVQMKSQPTQTAIEVAYRALFGKDSPYGYLSIGTEQAVKAIDRNDLVQFWSSHYVPSDSALIFAGDLTAQDARSLAEKYFGRWSSQGTISNPPSAPQPPARRVLLVDHPGAPQTALFAVGLGLPRATPDYAPVEVVNTMLGGLFSSRINMNLREEHGYTYGAFSRFLFLRGTGPFLAGASVRADVTAPAARELFKELDRIRTSPLSTDELKLAKDNLIRSLPGDFETTTSTVGQIANLWTYKLPTDYYRTYPAQIEAVTSAQAEKAALQYIHPENMLLIAVGDTSKIRTSLEDLKLGPVELWSTDAEPLAAPDEKHGNQ